MTDRESGNAKEFAAIKIGLASPEMIRSWSHGEVKKPETINYRTLKAERDGLYCERIFGPTKDWECMCGRYKHVRNKKGPCERCGVDVTTKKVRRERMGHIELACPVSHIWYFRAIPSRMSLLLEIPPKQLEQVLYFASYIVLDPGTTPLQKQQVLTDPEYREYYEKYEDEFRVGMGAEAVKELLQGIDLDALSEQLRSELEGASQQKKIRLVKRLEVVEAFRESGNRPEWMILDVIPVIPPEIRPLVPLDGGRFATSDLNDLYRRVISRNNRLKRMLEMNAPEIITRNEKRMLQEAVDALIDNGRRGKAVTGPSNRPLKSLSEMLRGKQGRFRQNLLGKRVDYSGRSVIVVGPTLKIYQCGLPKEMALELFKPFVIKRLIETKATANINEAKKKIQRGTDDAVWDALEVVIKEHPVLLNRAPTLHKLSIQAFEPVLVEGRAIKLHPLVCTAFNADFDGDQMPVHVPLSSEAQAEARFLMLSANNLLKPVDGHAVAVPSQDMVLGSYYLTIDKKGEEGDDTLLFDEEGNPILDENGEQKIDLSRAHAYRDFDEAMMAHANKQLGLHAPIRLRVYKERNGVMESAVVTTTLGRMIFNQSIPQDLGYVDRSDPANFFLPEISFTCGKKELGKIVDRCIKIHDAKVTAQVLDNIKAMGYKYSTLASLSISIADIVVPKEKPELIAEAEARVDKINHAYQRGLVSDEERYRQVINTWDECQKSVTKKMEESLSRYNPIKMMADSGARGSTAQMRQLAGMRGLMFSATGKTMEIPIKSNFREGMDILEYFIGARGSRKSLSDTALKTADSGYLTRRLVDVSQEVIVRETDCGTTEGVLIGDLRDGPELIEEMQNRIMGRFALNDIVHPETGEIIVHAGEMISRTQAPEIAAAGIQSVWIRSVRKCRTHHGVCVHCYGADMSTNRPVSIGEAVGIIAAQSIGEPGTQLTMRTFHTGGIASTNITQGLPRVEELFEARRPKISAVIAETSGTVSISDGKKARTLTITDAEGGETAYSIPNGTRIIVEEGSYVSKGDPMTEGHLSPQDITRVNGIDAAFDYLVLEVQKVYHSQSIEINDKHIEVITRQMTRQVHVDDSGDTNLLSGSVVDINTLEEANERVRIRKAQGEITLREAVYKPMLLGITKAALQTESFLSAASFQETTKVLTEAAIRGKTDHLLGLKENVIIGKLIPAGTGMRRYRDIVVEKQNVAPSSAQFE